MKLIWRRFAALNIWLQIIWAFCAWGFLFNTVAVCQDIHQGGVLLRLHLGFWILYGGQVVFILWGERLVGLLSLLQAVLGLFTNFDLTFVPVVRVLGGLVYALHGQFSVDGLEVYKYVFVSVCFTLEMWKTVVLFLFLPPQDKAAVVPTEK